MAPRTLNKAPVYNLDVKTRVPTGQVQRTDEADLVPIVENPISEPLGILKGLANIGYSIQGVFNQNNESNRVKGWDALVPEAQKDWNTLETKSLDQVDELNLELLNKYTETIRTSDYSKKVKDLILSDLSNYSERKMEQIYAKSISGNETTNINNFKAEYDTAIRNEDIGEANRLINKASLGQDAWMRGDTAEIYRVQAPSRVNFEIAKNDLAEMDYKTAYDTLQLQTKDENGDLVYAFSPGLSGDERVILEKTIAQAGTLEEQRKSLANYEASNVALDSLYNNEISVADFMKRDNEVLGEADKIKVVNTYESQQSIEVARRDSVASEPIWKDINNQNITDPDTIRAIDEPDLTERTRREMISFLETGVKTVDPYKNATSLSKNRLDALMRKAAAGDEPFSLMRSALRLTGETDDSDFPLLFGSDYNTFLKDVQNKAALSKLTSVVSGAEKDPRFIDEKTELQDPIMFDEFVRTYTELFYDQINEEDPEKQMNIDEFRSMADKLIDTISDEKLQEDFRKVSVSNQNVGTGLLTSWNSNKMEDAVTSLNEGMYDAMKYIEPEAWSEFNRKMIEQYELIKDEPYDKELRLYKDKIPVFLNKDGKEEMIIIQDGTPQVVSLDAGLDKYQNLALGYNVGDRNPEGETMLSTGWFEITNNSVEKLGTAYGGQIIRPKGEEEFYIITDTLQGVVVRPYHGDPTSQSDIAAAVKNVTNPIVETNVTDDALNDVENSIKETTPRSYYGYPGSPIVRDPEVPLTPAQKAQDALKAGRF